MSDLKALVAVKPPEYETLRAVLDADEEKIFSAGWRFANGDTAAYLSGLAADTQRLLLFLVFDLRNENRRNDPLFRSTFRGQRVLGNCLSHFGRSDLGWDAREVQAVTSAATALPFDAFWSIDEYRFVAGVAESYKKRSSLEASVIADLQVLSKNVSELSMTANGGATNNVNSIHNRFIALLPESSGSGIEMVRFSEDDEFGRRASTAAEKYLSSPELGPILQHFSKTTTTAKWKKETIRLSVESPVVVLLARDFIAILGEDRTANILPAPSSVALIKSAAGTLGLIGTGSDALLLEAAVRLTSGGIWSMVTAPRVCIEALGSLNDPEGLAALTRLQSSYRSGDVKKRVESALDAIATRQGLSRGQIVERQVATHDLTEQHERTIGNAELHAIVKATANGPTTTWFINGNATKAVDADIKVRHGELMSNVRTVVRQISSTMTAQRFRIEGIFGEGRTWTADDWIACYQKHPLVGPISSSLLWQSTNNDAWTTFVGDEPVPSGANAVRLWHPLNVDEGEIERWREELVRRELRQPFKQVFRERYILTPAEEQSNIYSTRFSGHQLRIDQLYALMKTRGWQAKWMGSFDGGCAVTPTFILADGNHRVGFDLELVDGLVEENCAASGAVHFSKRAGKKWQVLAPPDVPAIVFSESMRDVDLFVSVSNIANDPMWQQRLAARRNQHPEAASPASLSQELTPVGESRRSALAGILPKLKIASQCSLDDRCLRVKGTFADYSIHLGTGNIMMLPRNQYICIVTTSASAVRNVFLPFDNDTMLSTILSKAVMLAADHKITDESILRQIRSL